jgi:uroporphyrinogen decarboxylase
MLEGLNKMLSKAEQKKLRLKKALSHESPDRIPVSDFFWTGFIKNAKKSFGEDFDPYRYFDLDYVVVTPNIDPHIQPFEILSEEGEDVVLKTGFGAVVRRSGTKPMPHFESFSVKSPEEMAQFTFEDPKDPRRFYQGGDDQINCVGDALLRNLPDWNQRVDFYKDELAVFGSVCEPYEYLWRIIGTENAMYWMMEEPELFKDFVDRIGQFLLGFTEAQIEAGKGRLSGMYIWGDIAYRNGMLFNPDTWRTVFKPHVKALIDLCHKNGLMVIYHGCGNATPVFEDMIEIGLDGYNPLEVKAGLDAVELKKTYGSRLAFVGNIDVRILESGDAEAIKKEVLYKMRAGINGGWIFQSDHSVSSNVAPESYKLALDILREYGNYPLKIV